MVKYLDKPVGQEEELLLREKLVIEKKYSPGNKEIEMYFY